MPDPNVRKRPCRICRRWFMPNPRLKDRQMTCGNPLCKKEWHRKKCAQWNRKNSDYFKSNYLQKKIESATQSDKSTKNQNIPASFKSRFKTRLPFLFVQEAIGIQHLIIIEYLAQLLGGRFKEVFRSQLLVNTG